MSFLEAAAAAGPAAFFKARGWAWDSPYYDTIEIRLFEWRREESLRDVAKALAGPFAARPLLAYPLPKDARSARRYAWRNFFDEVASVSAVLALGSLERRMDGRGRVSFGNRLSPFRADDALYLPWEKAWEGFAAGVRRAARRAPWFHRSDIRNFYPEIPAARLREAIARHVREERARAALAGFLEKGRLPIGPAASGFLANLYLLDLDDFARGALAGAFARYVDDFFVFGRTRAERDRRAKRVRGFVGRRLGLSTHGPGKSRNGFSRDPLPRAAAAPAWRRPTALFDRVIGSLYRLTPGLWRLYDADGDRLLVSYMRGLRWLGIFTTTDFLAQRLLSLRARGRASNFIPNHPCFRLRFPMFDLDRAEREGMRGWAWDFRRMNPAFLRATEDLREMTRGLFLESWNRLGDLKRTPKKELKGTLFALRYWAARMSFLRGDGPTGWAFECLLDHPWAVEPRVLVNGLFSHPRRREILTGVLFSSRNVLVRGRAAWGLGEIGDPESVAALWEAGRVGGHPLVRRSALEALLRIDRWRAIEPAWVMTDHDREKDPGIRKFYSLLLSRMAARHRAPAGDVRRFLEARHAREGDWMARRALEFALSETASVFSVREAPAPHRIPRHEVEAGNKAQSR